MVGCLSTVRFLKGLGFKLEQIRSILSDERPERVLVDLLDQQTASLQSGIAEQKQRLDDCYISPLFVTVAITAPGTALTVS